MKIKVLVVTQNDPFYVPIFFESFFSEISPQINISELTVLDSFNEGWLKTAQRMYHLYGTKNLMYRGIEFLYRRLATFFGGKYSVPAVATRNGVPVEHRDSVNTEQFVSEIKHRDIDVILSVSAPEIFKPAVLSAPNWGCLNIHTSELPQYRGMLPTFWALYHGDEEIGVTVHTMQEEIDRGKIVRQTTFHVESPSLDAVIKRGKKVGGKVAGAALGDIASDEVRLQEMEGESSYFSFPTSEDRREFQRRGGRLF